MTQPTWKSPSNLGRFTSGEAFEYKLLLDTPSTITLLNGTLPKGLVLLGGAAPSASVTLWGRTDSANTEKTYVFTVRATSFATGEFSDRTFRFTLAASASTVFSQRGGLLFSTVDSSWVDYEIGVINPTASSYEVWLISGSLPQGLYLTKTGRIRGYASVPMNQLTGLPQTRTLTFTLAVDTDYGRDVKTFSITVTVATNRKPVIMNNTPPEDVSNDPYGRYYTVNGYFGVVKSGDEIAFKIIGKSFGNDALTYVYTGLPAGLTGDPVTGWVRGKITTTNQTYTRYTFSVQVRKTGASVIHSSLTTAFSFILSNSLTGNIAWGTPAILPVLVTGDTVSQKISATAATPLVYNIVSGSLPPNVSLRTNGDLSGRISFNPTTTTLLVGATTTYVFTVRAASPTYREIESTKEFTLTVRQEFSAPCDTLYLKVSPSIQDRVILDELLENTELIPTTSLYRSYDPKFGKASGIKIPVMFGVQSASFDQYIDAEAFNHSYKRLSFGELKTAVARDSNGSVMYEVVYAEVVDDLVNSDGVSVNKEVNFGGTTGVAYPNSLANMRDQIESSLGRNLNPVLLPKWMSSQQLDGNILGPVYAWVICYTLPGQSEAIKTNIETSWYPKINLINAEVDRYYVDKSASYNWNSDLAVPNWSSLPGAAPAPAGDEKDFYILFPNKNIQVIPPTA